MSERRKHGFPSLYYRFGDFCLGHRKMVLLGSLLVLVAGGYFLTHLRQQFFPKDLSYLSFVDVTLPEDSVIAATDEKAATVEKTIARVAEEYGKQHPGEDGKPRDILSSLTTFVGGGGPRFWFSVAPEILQTNYAQIVIRLNEKHDTQALVAPLQKALSTSIPGARVDVRELETGAIIGIPIQIRISGEEIPVLRQIAEQVKDILRTIPEANGIRDTWGAETFSVKLSVDADRANLSGISNLDVALSSAAGMSGYPVTTLRDGDTQIPVVTRLRTEERARLADIENLYVYSMNSPQKVPLGQLSSVEQSMETQRLQRRNQFRTITVASFPVPGVLPSQVMAKVHAPLAKLAAGLPPGYKVAIGGEE